MMGLGGLRDAPWPLGKAGSACAKVEALVPFENPVVVPLSLDLRGPSFSPLLPSVALPKELLVLLNWVPRQKSEGNRALELQGRFARGWKGRGSFQFESHEAFGYNPPKGNKRPG